jgi:predicted RNA-binding Zn-ribbon protein involved in translation (DUF1610 family)
MGKENVGRCPKCGTIGRNHQPIEAIEPDQVEDLSLPIHKVPFECLNCGNEWAEKVKDKDLY